MSNVKGKKKILKGAREKQFVTYKATFIRLSRDFSAATSQGQRKLHDIFKSDEREDNPHSGRGCQGREMNYSHIELMRQQGLEEAVKEGREGSKDN